jgi:uncharacterized membrane protein YeaQ/YmgE (transglycosylase-associated protein family)
MYFIIIIVVVTIAGYLALVLFSNTQGYLRNIYTASEGR